MVYYYDVNAKITFVEKLIAEHKGWNILIMDFDTQLSSLMNNRFLCTNCSTHPSLEIFLPYQITFSMLVDKLIEYDRCNSLVVIDSLNGLLDFFNFYGTHENSSNGKTEKGFKRSRSLNQGTITKHPGYKSFNLIKILFEYHSSKDIPVIVTSYQSQSSIDRLIFETISVDAFPHQENNHFRRTSNLVSLLEYFKDKDDLFMTILKKNLTSANKTIVDFSNFPHSRKIGKNPRTDSLCL